MSGAAIQPFPGPETETSETADAAKSRYWAFLSYSHADAGWAKWLHQALENYQIPRRLVGRRTQSGAIPKRLKPVFRDSEELGAAPNLSERLRRALADSASLIVICSPSATRSPWVNEEIRKFVEMHGRDRVFAVVVGGEPFASDSEATASDECFPEALRRPGGVDVETKRISRIEPIAADLRPGKDGRRGALIKLLAGLLEVELDEIVRRDAHRRHQQLLAFTAMLGVVAAGFAGLSILALSERNEARAESNVARTQRAQAEDLIEFMLGDLKAKLEPAGRLDALDAVGRKAMSYYAAQNLAELDGDSLGRRARVLHLMGDLREKRGDLDGALTLFRQAATSTGELLTRDPNDPQRIFDHAQSLFWVGDAAQRRGRLAEAMTQFQGYKRLADRLVAMDPRKEAWRAEVAYAQLDLGVVLLQRHRAAEAIATLQEALAGWSALALRNPSDRERQLQVAQCHAWLADSNYALGRLQAAMGDRLAERPIYEDMLSANPEDHDAIYSLNVNRVKVAEILLSEGYSRRAIREVGQATPAFEELVAGVPDDVDYRRDAAWAHRMRGRALAREGDWDGAITEADRAQALAQGLASYVGALAAWRLPVGAARVLRIAVAERQARTQAARKQELEPALAEASALGSLAAARPTDRDAAVAAARAALLAGDYRASLHDQAGAKVWWDRSATLILTAASDGTDPIDPESRAVLIAAQARPTHFQLRERAEAY